MVVLGGFVVTTVPEDKSNYELISFLTDMHDSEWNTRKRGLLSNLMNKQVVF